MNGNKLLTLLDSCEDFLTLQGAGPVCRKELAPGVLAAWTECGTCSDECNGMLYIRSDVGGPYGSFPALDLDPTCRKPLMLRLEIGVLRCAPTMTEDGEPPSAEEVTASALEGLLDRYALLCAIRASTFSPKAIELFTPVGPDGGCVGGFWSVWVHDG